MKSSDPMVTNTTSAVPVPARTVEELNTIQYNPAQRETNEECTICLQNFKAGEIVRILPCFHIFHQHCGDQWLLKHYTCPTCKTQAIMPTATPVGVPLQPTLNQVNEQYGQCRNCNRQFFREPSLRPQTSAYYRCPDCRGFDWIGTLKASCSIS